jgi:hypothetical protein
LLFSSVAERCKHNDEVQFSLEIKADSIRKLDTATTLPYYYFGTAAECRKNRKKHSDTSNKLLTA